MSLPIGGHVGDGLMVIGDWLWVMERPYYLWREERLWRKIWREGKCGKNVAGKRTNLRGRESQCLCHFGFGKIELLQ
jgi:hypothetical protein